MPFALPCLLQMLGLEELALAIAPLVNQGDRHFYILRSGWVFLSNPMQRYQHLHAIGSLKALNQLAHLRQPFVGILTSRQKRLCLGVPLWQHIHLGMLRAIAVALDMVTVAKNP
ncbi:hypothetical protein HNI00_14670 [Thermoleptolyngbya oregonensis NK1-22]|uniref:Uncharacterized protein n=1 Tax=Thermoleptolyngbya oregonensis NK1-22 TaxID=2547457 RepID=A0AA97BAC5_9CYAN|nr:hypothetical protein [Thermoleptolyngbya oregonensis]WOB44245.1 hypothetical protein HNI00_14670 [Thermoleptolyngbya oregonensis NK1-22]